MTTLLVVAAVVLAAACALAGLLSEPLEAVLPSTLFAVVLWLYAFGILDALVIGYRLLFVAIAGSLVAVMARRRNALSRCVTEGLLAPGLHVYLLLAVLTFAFTREVRLTHYDEFSHWGRVVKAMFVHGSIGPFAPVRLDFRSYPPASGLFEYLVAKLGGHWAEGNLLWGYQLLLGAMLVPFMSGLSWKSPGRVLVATLLAVSSAVLVRNPFTATLVDPLMGVTFGYLLALVYTQDDKRAVPHLVSGVAFLVLIKDAGLFLALIVAVAHAARALVAARRSKSRSSLGSVSASCAAPFAAILLTRVSWDWVLFSQEVNRRFANLQKAPTLVSLISGNGPGYWHEVIRAFHQALVSTPITTILGFPIVHAVWLAAELALLVLLAIATARGAMKPGAGIVLAAVFLGSMAYTWGILALYLFNFPRTEALRLAGYSRYLGVYWTGIAVFVASVSIWLIAQERRLAPGAGRITRVFVGLMCVAFVLSAPVKPVARSLMRASRESARVREPFDRIVREAEELGISSGDRVLVLSGSNDGGYAGYVLSYEMLDAAVDSKRLPQPQPPGSSVSGDMLEALQQQIAPYDYVVLYESPRTFTTAYAPLFEDPGSIDTDSIFRVVNRGDGAHLMLAR